MHACIQLNTSLRYLPKQPQLCVKPTNEILIQVQVNLLCYIVLSTI